MDKSVTVDTWNNTGYFYVRVLGNNGASATGLSYGLTVTTSGSSCASTLSDNPGNLGSANLYSTTSGGSISGGGATGTKYQTVIVDDSALMPAAAQGYLGTTTTPALYGPLQQLAGDTGGVVVDVGQSEWVDDLVAQAQANPGCPYAENLVAGAIQDIINTYRTTGLQYVVIVGDDDIIPFFRYPDTSGLAPESDYNPPLSTTSAADAALQGPEYLSDDQYGAATVLTYRGITVPLATAAVGRLVETPLDIYNTVESYTGGDTAIGTASTSGGPVEPSTSLVTGYDFMAAMASTIGGYFKNGLGAQPSSLITPPGVPSSQGWTATDLTNALFGTHHDLVFLGAHFSANNLLAADDTTTVTTNQFAAQVGSSVSNSLVISAGCHSGYNIDGQDAVPGVTDNLSWPQAFTEAGATLVAGTGYQYGDTNYTAYSDQIYADLAQQLGYGPKGGGPVSVGNALLDTKQNYLATLDELNGIQEKALLEVTLYGLPMLGVQEPDQGTAPGVSSSSVSATPVSSNPGVQLGLQEATLPVNNPTLTGNSVTPSGSPTTYTYDAGTDGVVADPAGPVLPVQLSDVNVNNETLRGVGLWSGSYSDTPGTNPLTGDPATDTGNSSVVPFASPVFYPQTLWNPNYFQTLINGGDTQLALTPVQYESDPGSSTTDTMRTYSGLDLKLFYDNNTSSYSSTQNGGYTNIPALAAPPTISDVTSTVSGDQVTVTANVTGDPSAGIQEVWVTYTGTGTGPLHGSWQSVDLSQDTSNTTQWTGTFTDSNTSGTVQGSPVSDAEFIVQAANGVGETSMDDNDGYYFTPSVTPGAPLPPGANSYSLALGGATSGTYQGNASVTATLTASSGDSNPNVGGQQITFDLGIGTFEATTNAQGVANLTLPLTQAPGGYPLTASYAGDANDGPAGASSTFQIVPISTGLQLSAPGSLVAGAASGVTATLTTGNVPLAQKPVFFVVSNSSGTVLTTSAITNANGVAQAGALEVPPAAPGNYTIAAYFGSSAVPLLHGTYNAADPDYGPSHATSPTTSVSDPPPTLNITAPSSVTATGMGTPVSYSVTDINYGGSSGTPSCSPASGSGFPVGKTTISCTGTDGNGGSTTVTATVQVVQAPLTISVSGSQTYGGQPTWSFTPSGLVVGDTSSVINGTQLTCSSTYTSSSPAGHAYQITSCSGLSAPSYYAGTYRLGSLQVTPAPLTITASSGTMTYGSTPPHVKPIYSGLENNDAAPATAPTCSTAATPTSPVGNYPASCSGASDPNYTITYQPGTVAVGAQDLMVIASSSATLYGQSVPTVTATYSGWVNGEGLSTITTQPTCTTAATSHTGVGKYATSCSGAADSDPNYTIIYVNGSAEIDPAPLTVTASSATITYGATPPAITPNYATFVNGDTASSLTTKPTCSTTATATSPLGAYPTTCSGAVDPNYKITYLGGTLTIGPSTMVVLGSGAGVVGVTGQSKLTVTGALAVNSSSSGAVSASGQSSIKTVGALISPASTPVSLSGQSTTSFGSVQKLSAEADPYAGLAAPPTSGLTVYKTSTIQGPGVYTQAVSISGQAKVQLASGTYVFDNGLSISGQAKVTSATGGVLLYFAGGTLTVSGQAGATLSPSATGTYAGVALFEARNDTQAIAINGQSQTTSFVGALYAPAAAVDVTGQSGLSVATLVVGSTQLNGQSTASVG